MRQGDLSYEFITSDIAPRSLFIKSSEFQAKIEELSIPITLPKLPLEKYNKGMVDKKDNKDNLVDLSTLIMIGVYGRVLSRDYTSIKDRMIYDEVWDKTK